MIRLSLVVIGIVLFSCQKGSTKNASGQATEAENTSSNPDEKSSTSNTVNSLAGTLVITLTPKEGAPPESVANAYLVADGRPEIEGKSDKNGLLQVNNVLPGTLAINVLSNDSGAALTGSSESKYGIRLPDVVIKSGQSTDLGNQTLKETGSISGIVAFHNNPNNLSLVGTQIFVPGTSFSAFSDESGSFKMSGLPEGEYDIFATKDGFSTLRLNGIKVVEAQNTLIGELALSLSNGPEGSVAITADITETINGVKSKIETSITRTVEFILSYDSDAALMKISDEPAFINKEWEPVSKVKSMTFTSDGLKQIYVMYSDLNGLESSPYFDRVYVDTEAPVISSFSIMNDWIETAVIDVLVETKASDSGSGVASIMFSNVSGEFNNSEVWETYNFGPSPWRLSDGVNGSRTTYVRVKDFAGRVSDFTSDVITKGAYTRITEKIYSSRLDLYEKFSPYLLTTNNTSVDKKFSLGAEMYVHEGSTVYIQSLSGEENGITFAPEQKITAIGSQSKKIVFASTSVGVCNGHIDFQDAIAGVGEKNRFEHVKFINLKTITAKGGVFKNSNFEWIDGSCGVSKYSGIFRKSSGEPLTIENPFYNSWYRAIQMLPGSSNASISGGSGNLVQLAVIESGGGTGLSVSGGTYTLATNAGTPHLNIGAEPISIAAGSASIVNTSFTGHPDITFMRIGTTDAVTIAGLNVNSAKTFVELAGNNQLTVSNSIATNFETGVKISSGASQPKLTVIGGSLTPKASPSTIAQLDVRGTIELKNVNITTCDTGLGATMSANLGSFLIEGYSSSAWDELCQTVLVDGGGSITVTYQ